ncbi:hypothetical protein [Candidatus Thiodubiliella endoseptemdiera]
MKIRNILVVVLSLFSLQGCTIGESSGEKKTSKVSMFKGISATQVKQDQVKSKITKPVLKTAKPVSSRVKKSTFADIVLETTLVDGKLPKRKGVKKVVKSKSSK